MIAQLGPIQSSLCLLITLVLSVIHLERLEDFVGLRRRRFTLLIPDACIIFFHTGLKYNHTHRAYRNANVER